MQTQRFSRTNYPIVNCSPRSGVPIRCFFFFFSSNISNITKCSLFSILCLLHIIMYVCVYVNSYNYFFLLFSKQWVFHEIIAFFLLFFYFFIFLFPFFFHYFSRIFSLLSLTNEKKTNAIIYLKLTLNEV